MTTALSLLLVVAFILLNGFFVAAEFSLVRARRERVEDEAEGGSRMAKIVLAQVKHIDAYLAACQVGITMASIGLGWVGEPVIADLLKPLFGTFLGNGAAIVIAAIVAFSMITGAHIIFGELAPKTVAIANTMATLKFLSLPLQWFKVVFWPVIWLLNSAANGFMRLFGVSIENLEEATSGEDIKLLISRGGVAGRLERSEAEMLKGVFHLHEQEARRVMTPIPAVVTANAQESVETALKRCVASGHTRLLVTGADNPDQIRGIVHTNTLTRISLAEGGQASIEPAIQPLPIVPETRPLDEVLSVLQQERSSMAVVVNEYGRTEGIITVEDIVEEVVGEIVDETDREAAVIRRLASGDWFVRGHVSLDDLADVGVALPVDTDAFTSVGGFVFDELGRLPKRGDTVKADGYTIRVESVRENRIEAVRIIESGHPSAPDDAE